MSFVRRDPPFGQFFATRPAMPRGLALLSAMISERRPKVLIVGAAVSLIVAATAATLIFKSHESSSPRVASVAKPVALPAPAPAPAPKVEPELAQIWDRLEPAYRSYKIQVGNDNSLQTASHAVELYGAQIIPRTQVCRYLNGERWACGQRAYVALLNIFGGTTVDCKPRQINQPHIVVCQLGGKDIAELMLREGWAKVADGVTGQTYVEAAATAAARKAGMYRLETINR